MSHKNVFKSPEAITITCTATGQSASPSVVMWRDEKGKTPQFLNVTLKSNNTVTTATYMSGKSNMSMSGSYVCVATEDGKVKGESINIDVKGKFMHECMLALERWLHWRGGYTREVVILERWLH